MKVLSKSSIAVLISGCLLFSCKPNVRFTEKDLMITRPFNALDTVVFFSSKGQRDTIVFFPAKVDTISYRNFEQGFYDQYVLRVSYILMPGSYHKIVTVDKFGNPERFYSCSVSDLTMRELGFLGLVFDGDALMGLGINDTIISFNREKATYTGVNVNEGIDRFNFSPKTGVVSYTAKGNEWVRDTVYKK